jgi:hypothetical protein
MPMPLVTQNPRATMLFFAHQEPPPIPPAIVQEAAVLDLGPHGSHVGPPKSLMLDAKIDFKKFSERSYVEIIVIEGQAEPVDKMPMSNQLSLPIIKTRAIFGRPMYDSKYNKIVPFWMNNVYGIGHNIRTPACYYPVGWGY